MTYLNIVEDSRAKNLHILHAWMLWIVFGTSRMKDALWTKTNLASGGTWKGPLNML